MFAQGGKSETLLDILGQRFDQAPVPTLYVGPTRKFIEEQFEPRIMDLLDEAPVLAGKVTRGKKMTKSRKVIAGVPLRLAHAGSSTALKSDPFALALTDEADEMMANVKGQGNPLTLIDRRGDTHAGFVHAIVSTPSEGRVETEHCEASGLDFFTSRDVSKIPSTIWRLFLQGTRHHTAWPCPGCGEYFIPRLACLEIPEVEETGPDGRVTKRRATAREARMSAYVKCPRCKFRITDEHKAEIASPVRSRQVAPGERVLKDGTVEGEPAPSETYSDWTTGLASPFRSIADRAAEYVGAIETGQHDQIQAVVNGSFGEPYAIAPLNAPKWEAVRRKALPYRTGEVPREVMRLVAGVDVQGDRLYFVLRGFGSRGASWLIQAGTLYGPTASDEVWDQLTELLTSRHGGLQVELALIDSGFRPNKPDAGDPHRVYEYCRRWDWLAKPTKGRASQQEPLRVSDIEVRADKKRPAYSLKLILVDTDHFKSLVHSRLVTPADRWGSINLPADVTEDYCRQMVSEVREIVDGKPVWVQVDENNHWLDCEALAAAAGRLLNVERIPENVAREWDETALSAVAPRAAAPESAEAEPASAPVPKPTPPSPAPKQDFR